MDDVMKTEEQIREMIHSLAFAEDSMYPKDMKRLLTYGRHLLLWALGEDNPDVEGIVRAFIQHLDALEKHPLESRWNSNG